MAATSQPGQGVSLPGVVHLALGCAGCWHFRLGVDVLVVAGITNPASLTPMRQR